MLSCCSDALFHADVAAYYGTSPSRAVLIGGLFSHPSIARELITNYRRYRWHKTHTGPDQKEQQ
jgi:hypothetical protein